MITIRKLKTLKESTRLRKYIATLVEIENKLRENKVPDYLYIRSLFNLIGEESGLHPRVYELLKEKLTVTMVNNLKHGIMKSLGIEPSEWDFIAPADKNRDDRTILDINLYLDDIRSPFNLGSIFRSAECFGVKKIILSKDSTTPDHQRAKRTSMGCIDIVDWEIRSISKIEVPVFALELGGTSIDEFQFPQGGMAIIGSEELGVSPEALKLADKSLGRVSIPLIGSKSSLNVANATSILLHRWSETLLKKN